MSDPAPNILTSPAPRVSYDPALPISAHVDEIAGLLRDHQVIVVAGETGSGKTTQLPKICLQIGREHIGHTQPRRIAARSVAERLASELDVQLGDLVGYQVRFTRQAGRDTRIKVMTDGILLAEITRDRELRHYDTIIIDEAHERSLNIDFLLGYLKQLLPRRRDLRVIITSATIDTARFSEHFGDAPVVEVSGRTFPVEVRYRPLDEPDRPEVEPLEQAEGIVRAVRELSAEGPGDILVFCSGDREIRDADTALTNARLDGTEVLPLHSRLSSNEQHRVFSPHAGRRIILSTNIAETSVTVPGIRYVVDAGTARISRYSARTKVQRLPIEPISRASANQRAGRCGRVAPGICVRLYSQEDYESRPEFTEPEILRTNLASVILQMARADLGDITDFPFVEAPDAGQIGDGIRLLDELGALKPRAGGARGAGGARRGSEVPGGSVVRLTRVGRALADLPIDPRLGRMLIEASGRDALREVLVVVSFLAIPDVRERPAEHRDEADRLHARFFSDDGLEDAGRESSDAGGAARPFDELKDRRQGNLQDSRQGNLQDGRQGNLQDAGGPGEPLRHTAHTSGALRAQMLAGKRRGGNKSRTNSGSAGKISSAGTDSVRGDPGGDIMAIVRLWRYLEDRRRELSGNQFRRMCRDEYLNYLRVREWQDLHIQLKQVCKDLDMHRNGREAPTEQVLTSVLSGLLSHVGLQLPPPAREPGAKGRRRRPVTEYAGARGARFAIQPGSALARRDPQLVMAVELVETSRLWARTVAAVEPEWVEQVGAHLLKRSYSEPHWSSSSASVVAYEKVTLLGVPIIADRAVGYASVDAAVARQIFIRSGLVEGQWHPSDTHADHGFLAHNAAVLRDAEDASDRIRRRGMVVDDQDVYDFYDLRLPSSVVSGATFDDWWRGQPDPTALEFSLDMLTDSDELDDALAGFPERWPVAGLNLPVSYVFEPGHERDGVAVRVPLAQLNQLEPEPFSWQVPGLRLELATELVRALPKQVRTNFVPAPDHARNALTWLEDHSPDHERRFCDELGRALRALTGVVVDADQWRPDLVPAHLRVGFEVTSPGKPSRYGRDLAALRQELSQQVSRTITRAAPKAVEATSWTFGTIEPQVQIRRSGITAVGYPALKDLGRAVTVVMATTPEQQAASHRLGVRRLLVLVNPDPTRWTVSHLSNAEKLVLPTGPYPSVPSLLADARLKAVDQCARRVTDPASVRDEAAFERLALAVRQEQADQMRRVVTTAASVLELAREVRAKAARVPSIGAEVLGQLDNLVFDGFISYIRDPWYDHLPRYLKAMIARLDLAAANPAREVQLIAPIDEVSDEYDDLVGALPPGRMPDAVDDVGFWIEELRVQAFAQTLGTSLTVSPKRIRKAIAALP